MAKVAVITDSNSGMTQNEAKDNLFILPMPFIIEDKGYYEDINLTQQEFYEKLKSDVKISTSQPSYGEVTDLWNKVLKDYDEIVYIPMSSGLSQSCESAARFAEEEYKGKVFVVNNQRISVTQRASVVEALELVKEGLGGQEIKDYLEKTKMDSSIYITVQTLKYLKRGGRVTPAAAAIATMLSIKPILQIQGEKLDKFAMVMNMNQARSRMIQAVKNDLETRFKALREEKKMALYIAHTENYEMAEKFKKELEEAFPDLEVKNIDPLSLSVSCHIGPGAIAVAVSRYRK